MIKKVTVEMNLSELLDYVIKHNIKEKYYTSKNGYEIYITSKQELYIMCHKEPISKSFPLSETFEIEVTAEVYDTGTIYGTLLTENVHGIYRLYKNKSIKQLPFFDSYYDQYNNIYVMKTNQDLRHIFKDGSIINEIEIL